MISTLLLCCAFVGDNGAMAITPADRALYEAAQSTAGSSAAAQVKLALWCEAHGLTAERVKHLALAIAADPSNALAHGLAGLVDFQGKWTKPQDVGNEIKNDAAYQALIREYLDRRLRTPDKADPQWRLANWCSEKGLKDQALAHYSNVVRLDPSRETAWKHLGYKKIGGSWVKPEVVAAQKLEADHQRRADSRWKPRLEKLREGLESPHAARRDKARSDLASVTDPRAVPMIWRVFANGSEAMQLTAVRLLAQIEGASASNALATLAIFKSSAQVRQRAKDALMRRDPRDVVGHLINLIKKPYKYKVEPGKGPGSSAVLLVDGETFDIRRIYHFPAYDPRLRAETIPLPMSQTPMSSGFGGSSGPLIQSRMAPNPFPGSAMIPSTSQAAKFVGRLPTAGLSTARTGATGGAGNAALFNASMANNVNFAIAFNQSMVAQAEMMMYQAMLETVQRDQAVQQSLDNDVQTIEAINAQANAVNDQVLPLLRTLTGQNLGDDPEPWRKWWNDQTRIRLSIKPAAHQAHDHRGGGPSRCVAGDSPVPGQPRPDALGVFRSRHSGSYD